MTNVFRHTTVAKPLAFASAGAKVFAGRTVALNGKRKHEREERRRSNEQKNDFPNFDLVAYIGSEQ